MATFAGALGAAAITVEVSDDGSTWTSTGAVITAGNFGPKPVALLLTQLVAANVGGVGGGTSATVRLI